MTISLPRSLLLGLSLVLAACGGEGLTLPPDGAAANIEVTWGSGQSARVGSTLPESLVVKVTDTRDRPVAGANVVFEFTADGSAASPATASTDANGIAWSRLVLGTRVGTVNGTAKVPTDAGVTPVLATFTATVLPGDANGISLVSGDGQSAPVNSALPAPLVVLVTDLDENPISNETISWSITGGGSVSQASTVTDANGQTSVTRTLGPTAGDQTTVATAPGLAHSPITFTHHATAGNAATVVKIAGDVGTAPAGSVVEATVEVRDASSNPISNAPVTWLVGEGAGSATPLSGNTNLQGRATTQWTLGSAPGTNTLNVVSSGGATTTFTVTGTGTGSPSSLAVTTQPPPSVTVGATLTPGPVIQVKDAGGNNVPAAGIEITAGLASGQGSLGGTQTVATDANGQAQFTDLRISGATGSHRLIFAADPLRSIRSNSFDVTKATTSTTITDSPDPSDQNEPVTVSFTVTSSAGTPTGDVKVTVSGAGANCTGTLSLGSGSCQLTDLASSGTLTATYQGNNLFATSSGDAPHTVNAPNQAPSATFNAPVGCTAGSACVFDGTLASDPDGTIASWSWVFGDPTSVDNSSTEKNPSHTYALAGDYTVTLTVTDNEGATDTVSHPVTIQ